MAFGDEFQNLSPIEGGVHTAGLIPGPSANPVQNADLLIRRIQGLTPPGGGEPRGFLYFTPGRYYLGRPTLPPFELPGSEFGDIVIPPEVTLWFAPGAVLVPLAGTEVARRPGQGLEELAQSVRIEIHGDIIAERRQIFSVWLDENDPSSPAGVILLLGDRIREVYPEWWGASPEALQDSPANRVSVRRNAAAIQAAIDAAYHRRVSPRRSSLASVATDRVTGAVAWNRRPSIPIVMMGQYLIDREVHVGVPATWMESADPLKQPPLSGFELEGERTIATTGTGKPSLVAATDFVGRALLAIRGPTTFSVRNLSFYGNYQVRSCVTVEPIDAAWGCASFDGCAFFLASASSSAPDASTAQVVLDAESRRRPARPGVTSAAPRDYWNVAFKRCTFLPAGTVGDYDIGRKIMDRRIPDTANNVVGVEVRLGDNEGLDFRECWFRGAASPGIRAFSGRFTMNNCVMHLTRPLRLDVEAAPVGTYTTETIDGVSYPVHPDWRLPDHPHGSDILIEAPRLAPPSSGVAPLIPASFTLHSHVSHSWQVFAAKPIPASAFSASKASPIIVLGLKSVLEESPAARELEPPTIYWPQGCAGSIGSPLVLVGCQFAGKYYDYGGRVFAPGERDRYGRVVFAGAGLEGKIFNLGSNLFDAGGSFGGADRGLTEAVRIIETPMGLGGPVLQLRTRAPGP